MFFNLDSNLGLDLFKFLGIIVKKEVNGRVVVSFHLQLQKAIIR